MVLIEKKELLEAIKQKFWDLDDNRGCCIDNGHLYEWLSIKALVELIEDCSTYSDED